MLLFYLSLLDTQEEKDKFTRIYEKYRQTMFYTASQILHDEDLAEDAVHNAFLRIIRNLHKIKESEPEKTRGFVTVIVRNVAISMKNKYSREVPDICVRSVIHMRNRDEGKNDCDDGIGFIACGDAAGLGCSWRSASGTEIRYSIGIGEGLTQTLVGKCLTVSAKSATIEVDQMKLECWSG